MLDGVNIEHMGIAASVICTQRFVEYGQEVAAVHGYADFPLVQISHPLAAASHEYLQKEARKVVNIVLENLLITSG